LRVITLPALARGRSPAGLDMTGFQISGLPSVVTGASEEEFTACKAAR
jgi:hypothetical protein